EDAEGDERRGRADDVREVEERVPEELGRGEVERLAEERVAAAPAELPERGHERRERHVDEPEEDRGDPLAARGGPAARGLVLGRGVARRELERRDDERAARERRRVLVGKRAELRERLDRRREADRERRGAEREARVSRPRGAREPREPESDRGDDVGP